MSYEKMSLQETMDVLKREDYLKYLVNEKASEMYEIAKSKAVSSLEKQKLISYYIDECRIMANKCMTFTAQEVLVMLESLSVQNE